MQHSSVGSQREKKIDGARGRNDGAMYVYGAVVMVMLMLVSMQWVQHAGKKRKPTARWGWAVVVVVRACLWGMDGFCFCTSCAGC